MLLWQAFATITALPALCSCVSDVNDVTVAGWLVSLLLCPYNSCITSSLFGCRAVHWGWWDKWLVMSKASVLPQCCNANCGHTLYMSYYFMWLVDVISHKWRAFEPVWAFARILVLKWYRQHWSDQPLTNVLFSCYWHFRHCTVLILMRQLL